MDTPESRRALVKQILTNRSPGTNFADVRSFHMRFDVGPQQEVPHLMALDLFLFREKFLREELNEISEAYHSGDLVKFIDGLVDLVYVAMGTADLASMPWEGVWQLVQWANMQKVRAQSAEESLAKTGRGHATDIIKPAGWIAPEPLIREFLIMHGAEGLK